MRRKAVTLSIIFLAISMLSLVGAQSYSIPGSYNGVSYNNIGISDQVTVDLNVTLVNTANYPKFVIVNPRYDFKVYRNAGTESLTAVNINGSIVHVPGNLQKDTLNYFVGFWIMPYETVVVNFRITDQHPYTVQMFDYKSLCGDQGRLTSVSYEGNNISGTIGEPDEITHLTCGVIYPQIINAPQVMYLQTMFPVMDNSIKVIRYYGTVTMKLTNVPGNTQSCLSGDCANGSFGTRSNFETLFAVTVPIIFNNATMYGYTPNYTMTFGEYLTYISRFNGMNETSHHTTNTSPQLPGMFGLTDKLLSGVTIPQASFGSQYQLKTDATTTFPVWVILMSGEVDITYHVSWNS